VKQKCSATFAEQVFDLLRLAVEEEGERLDELLADMPEVAGVCGLAIYADLFSTTAVIAGA